MADVTKDVEIALKIVGANDTTLTTLVGAFEKIQTAVNNASTSIDNFKTKLDSIQVPSGMTQIVESFNTLKSIKFNNLDKIAIGFEKLKEIGKAPDLTTFAAELSKISAVGTLPNLGQIGTGFATIVKTPLDGFSKKVDALVTALGRLAGIGTLPNLGQIGNGLSIIMDKQYNLGQLGPKITSLVTALGRLAEIGTLPNLGQIGTGLKNIMTTSVDGFAKKIAVLHAGMTRLSQIDLTKIASVLENLTKVNLTKLTNKLQATEKALRETGTSARNAGMDLSTFAGKVQTVSTFRVIAEGFNLLKQAILGGRDAIIDYDQSLKDLQAITGATSIEVSQMGDTILEVASSTKFSASEIAEGMRIIGQTGFSASEAVQTMQSVSDLATGTLSTMATTVDLVTTAMRVFRIDAENSAQVADVFANAVNRSKLTIDKLRTAMNFVGPIARDSGVSFKELSASMGTLANSGLRASTIGTGLRRIFAELIDPSKKLKEAIEGTGVTLEEIDPRVNSLSSVLANLGIVVNDASVAFDVFGKRGASAVLALTSAGSNFDSMMNTLSESGTAARQAAKQMEGLGVAFKNLRDRAGVLAIKIGEAGVTKAMKIFIEVTKSVVKGLTYLADTTFGKVVIGLGVVTASVYALITAFNLLKIKAGFGLIISGLQQVASMAVLAETSVLGLFGLLATNPIVLSITALVAVISGLVYWFNRAKESAEEFIKTSDEFNQLTDQVKKYSIAVAGLTKDSREYIDANKVLRKQLLGVAESYSDVSTEALAAALSIDPLTGNIKEGSKALEVYIEKLNKVNFDKLIAANEAVNKSFNQSDTDKDFNFYFNVEDSIPAFEKAQEEVAVLEGLVRGLTTAEKEFIDDFHVLELQAAKNIKYMEKIGKFNLNDTIQNFTRLAKEQKVSGVVLEAMVSTFKELQSSQVPTNAIKKWAKDGSLAIADFIEQYENMSGEFGENNALVSAAQKQEIIESIGAKKALLAKVQSLEAGTAAMREAHLDEETIVKRHLELMAEYNAEASAIIEADDKNVLYQKLKTIQKISAEYEKAEKENTETYKTNIMERERLQQAADAAYLKSLDILRQGDPIDLDAQEDQHKDFLNSLKLNYEKHLHEIALSEAKGVLTSVQADAAKTNAKLKYFKDIETEAIRFFGLLDGIEFSGDDNYEKRLGEQKKAQANAHKEMSKSLVDYTDAVTKANEKIEEAYKDSADEYTKYQRTTIVNSEKSKEKLLTIERAYAEKLLKINESLKEKLKKIDKEIADNSKDIKIDILDIETSTAEKIRKIKKESMSETAQQYSDEKAAAEFLKTGLEAIAKAKETGDKKLLTLGVDRIKQSESIASGLEDEHKAIKTLKKVMEGLKDARNVQGEIKELELLKKALEENEKAEKARVANESDYNNKVNAANTATARIEVKEEARHAKAISNLQAEINEHIEKGRVASEILANIGNDEAIKKIQEDETKRLAETYAKNVANNKAIEDAALAKDAAIVASSKKSHSELEIAQSQSYLKEKKRILEKINDLSLYEKKVVEVNDTIIESVDENGVKIFETLRKSTDDAINGIDQSAGAVSGALKDTIFKVGEAAKASDVIIKSIDENGVQVFETLKQKGTDAVSAISESAEAVKSTLKDVNDVAEAQSIDTDSNVDSDSKIAVLRKEIDELINADKIINVIVNVTGMDKVNLLIEKLKELKDKTITITEKWVQEGSSSSSSNSGVSAFAGGGRLPGFGGGDRNPALLEDGEWIINKYAVRKFGDSFMASINNMTLPKFQNGGAFKSSPISAQAIKPASPFGSLSDFGKVSIDTGKVKFPVMAHKNVVSELNSHFNKMRLVGVN